MNAHSHHGSPRRCLRCLVRLWNVRAGIVTWRPIFWVIVRCGAWQGEWDFKGQWNDAKGFLRATMARHIRACLLRHPKQSPTGDPSGNGGSPPPKPEGRAFGEKRGHLPIDVEPLGSHGSATIERGGAHLGRHAQIHPPNTDISGHHQPKGDNKQ